MHSNIVATAFEICIMIGVSSEVSYNWVWSAWVQFCFLSFLTGQWCNVLVAAAVAVAVAAAVAAAAVAVAAAVAAAAVAAVAAVAVASAAVSAVAAAAVVNKHALGVLYKCHSRLHNQMPWNTVQGLAGYETEIYICLKYGWEKGVFKTTWKELPMNWRWEAPYDWDYQTVFGGWRSCQRNERNNNLVTVCFSNLGMFVFSIFSSISISYILSIIYQL